MESASGTLLFLPFAAAISAARVSKVGRLRLVVAVAEEGCYRINAIRTTCSIVKRRKLHGALLSKQMVASGQRNQDGWKLSVMMAAVLNSAHCSLVSVYEYMVFTVYYDECKKSYGGRGKIESAHKLMFRLL